MERVPEESEPDPTSLRLTSPSSPHPPPVSPPIHVARYQEESQVPWHRVHEIGRGSYSVVDKVEDTRNNNAVYARKKMKRESNRIARRNFNNEYENLLRLHSAPKHHYVVELIQAYTFRDDYYLVISPLAGMTLRDLFDRVHGRYLQGIHDANFRVLRRAFGCLAQGLAFLHTNGIRHKDVKPTNILILGDRVIYTGGTSWRCCVC
jgi:serine/threonine protein kinase